MEGNSTLEPEKLMKLFTLFFLLLTLASCGSKPSSSLNTSFVFTSGLSALDSQSGGIVLYGKNKNDPSDAFAFVVGRDGDKLELTNGTWEFMAVSWNGYNSALGTYGNKMEGEVRCSRIANKELSGGDIELTIVLDKDTCRDSAFGLSDTKATDGPKRTSFYSCSNQDAFDRDNDEDERCFNSIGGSFQAVLMAKASDGRITETLKSRCIINDSASITTGLLDSVNPHNLRLPIFFPREVGPIWSIRVFEDSSCNRLASNTTYLHPYAEETTGHLGGFDSGNEEAENSMIVYTPVCGTTPGEAATPFISHKSDATEVYRVLCNKNQFTNFISQDSSTLSEDYRLGRNIDFGGSTFSNSLVAGNFSGTLRGNGHALQNLILDVNADNSGIFSTLTTNAHIENLNLNQIELNCSGGVTSVGALVGNSTDAIIRNIKASGISVFNDSCNHIGALIGYSHSTSGDSLISGIDARDIHMDLNGEIGNNIGGLFGGVNGGLQNITANGVSIDYLSYPGTANEGIGGIVGFIEQANEVSNIYASNIRLGTDALSVTNALSIGLFAGLAENNSNLRNIKIVGSISAHNSTDGVGGVFGKAISSTGSYSNIISEVDIFSEGNRVGGIVGISQSNTRFEYLRSSGSIECASQCGGLIGSSSNSEIVQSYNATSLSSSVASSTNDIGGIVGLSTGDETILGVQNVGEISFGSPGNGANIGGIIGKYSGSGGTSNLNLLINHANVTGYGASIGGIIGSVTSDDIQLTNFLNTGNAVSENNSAYAILGSFTEVNATTANYDGYQNNLYYVTGSIQTELSIMATYTPVTLEEAEDPASFTGTLSTNTLSDGTHLVDLDTFYRFKTIGALHRLGNSTEPFIIDSEEKWNSIGDSVVFMQGYFILGRDLDFDGIPFTPIGSSINAFQGTFLGNDYKLSNIELNTYALGVGIFAKTENAFINVLKDENLEYEKELYIENLSINISSTSGSLYAGSLVGYAYKNLYLKNVNINGSNINITLSGADGGYIGGLVGYHELISDHSNHMGLVDVVNSSISGSGGDWAHVGGVFGKISSSISTASSPYHEYRSFRVIDTSVNGFSAGGLAAQLYKDDDSSLSFENVLVKSGVGHSIAASSDHSGGVFANVGNIELRHFAVHGVSIQSSGVGNVGGVAGVSTGGTYAGGYVEATASAGTGFLGCFIGQTLETGTFISVKVENSYANCSSLSSSGTTSYYIANRANLYTVVNDDVFYTAPSDEGISGITYLTTAQLSDENFMTSAHPNFYSGDPWMWELGGMPRTVMEVFPQYFFQ